MQSTSWKGFISGAAGDGADGIAMAELNGALVLSISNNDRVLARYCGADCLVDTSWKEAVVDSAQAMSVDYDPVTYVGAVCNGSLPLSANWHLIQGVVAVRPDASLAFAHTTTNMHLCAGSTSVDYLPGFGRLVYLP